jgi:hypothetical protein
MSFGRHQPLVGVSTPQGSAYCPAQFIASSFLFANRMVGDSVAVTAF